MSAAPEDLPNDVAALRALLLAERAHHASELAERDSRLERLMAMLQTLRRAQFGRRSEKFDPAQLALALEDLEIVVAAAQADEEKHDKVRSTPRRAETKRVPLPAHLPRIEQVLENRRRRRLRFRIRMAQHLTQRRDRIGNHPQELPNAVTHLLIG
mgnify:CR=1 FL=1